MTSYDLSRAYFDWCFENPEKVSPNHTAIYFFAIEHCNRLGWKEKFGFPTQMAMDAIGIKKNQTYIRYFNDLVTWGFFKLIEKSKNQYSANIISLQSALPKNGKALDKALIKHTAKQTESIGLGIRQSNSPIDKPLTINKEQLLVATKEKFICQVMEFTDYPKTMLENFIRYWTELNEAQTKMRFQMEKTWEVSKRLATWKARDKGFTNTNPEKKQYRMSNTELCWLTDAEYEAKENKSFFKLIQ